MDATNLIGRRVTLRQPYHGRRHGQVHEVLNNGHYLGVHLAGYYYREPSDQRLHNITVDFSRREVVVHREPACPMHEQD